MRFGGTGLWYTCLTTPPGFPGVCLQEHFCVYGVSYSGTWLYCGVHFKLTCVHGIREGSLHSTRCVPCFCLGLFPPHHCRCLGFHFKSFARPGSGLGVCFTRCALAVCVTLRLSGPWCPGWSCFEIVCWSYFLFVRQVVWGESKTEVLCCNCFWHLFPSSGNFSRGRALHWWNVKIKHRVCPLRVYAHSSCVPGACF